MGLWGQLEWRQLLAVVFLGMVVLLGGHSGWTIHLDTVMDILFLYWPGCGGHKAAIHTPDGNLSLRKAQGQEGIRLSELAK